MRKIVGLGETVLDIIFRDDKPTAAIPGGSTFNALISLGRTVRKKFPEVPVLMVTETGDDHVGDIVTSFMEENGVSTAAVTRNPGTQTHVSLAFLDSNNDARYQFYKDHGSASLDPERVSGISFAKDDLVLFGSYFAINPKIRNYTRKLLTEARKAEAVIYYDINFRKNHLRDLTETLPNIQENCRLSDFVRGSAEDFGYLFGTEDPEDIYRKHIKELCPNFICTCGSRPIHVFTEQQHFTFSVEQIDTVSTIGAGDNFNAGFIYALLSLGISRERAVTSMEENGAAAGSALAESRDVASILTEDEWKQVVNIAGKFSANVCRSLFNYVDPDFEI